MKKTMSLSAILCCLAVSLLAASPIALKVKVQSANVRSKPDMKSTIIAQLKMGTLLTSSSKIGEFYEIGIPDKEGQTVSGFVHGSVVEIIGEPESGGTTKDEKTAQEAEVTPENKARAAETVPRASVGTDSEPKKMGLGLSLGLGSSSHYGSGLAFGANFTFAITKNIGIEVSGFRYQTSAKESDDVTRLSKGKLATIPLQLSLVGRFPLNPMVVPYVLAGGGYYLNTFDLDGNIVGNWSDLGFDADEKVDNAFGFHFGAGLDYFINPNIAVGVNGRYCIVKGKGSWLLRDQVTGEEIKGNLANLSLNSIILVLSLKYFF